MQRLLFILALNSAAFAQPGPEIPRLRQFLNLTEAQYQQLTDNFNQYGLIAAQAYDRMDRLYSEIVEETARTQPRPAELGMRYVDIELTCRQTVEELARLKARNLALLTTAQKGRLQILLDAIKLVPEIGEAQDALLIDGDPVYFGGYFPSTPTPEPGGSCSLRPYPTSPGENRSAGLSASRSPRDKLRTPLVPAIIGRKPARQN
ncbi:MAG: hypothetical protein JST93_21765 [Acidobacteria bacterium]|nr:hypothetical protein [Acidobacteriota bacterium]